MGVTNKSGKVVGLVSTGLSIESMRERLLRLTTLKAQRAVLINDEKIPIFFSDAKSSAKTSSTKSTDIQKNLQGIGTLETPIIQDGVKYTHFARIDGYPFTFFFGYDRYSFLWHWLQEIFVETLLIICLFAASSRLFWKFFHTTNNLHIFIDFAARYARGQKLSRREKQNIPADMRPLLVPFLSGKRRAIYSNISYRKQLKSWHKKELLNQAVHGKLREVVNRMHVTLHVMEDSRTNALLRDAQEYLLKTLRDSITQLQNLSSHELNSEVVDLGALLRLAFAVSQIKSRFEGINMRCASSQNFSLPPFLGDSLKLQQVFVSVLSHSIECTREGGNVVFDATLKIDEEGKPESFCFSVNDDGLGLNEEERKMKWDEMQQIKRIFNTRETVTQIDFDVIRKIVGEHNGTFEFTQQFGKGSTFSICIPYVEKIEDPKPAGTKKLTRQQKNKNDSGKKSQPSGGNIVPFSKT
jgi:signal transduction histidine kinase